MTVNEMLMNGITLRSVLDVIRITDPDEANPYGDIQTLYRFREPVDLTPACYPLEWDWANREVDAVWPNRDDGFPPYPLIQIEVR